MTEKFYDDKKDKDHVKDAKAPPPTREALRHNPDRDISEYIEDEEQDRLRIPKSEYPPGFDLQWVTHSIFGQLQRQHRASFERKGWVPVLGSDFDGKYGRQFMPEDWGDKEIEIDGLVLMARPKKFSERARLIEDREAFNRVNIKEKQLMGGDLPGVSLDPRDPSALRSNVIRRSVETISVPDDRK